MALATVNSADAETLRHLYPRVLAKVLSFTNSLPDAEDAVQDALARALATWQQNGIPDSPEAWLVTVSTNAHRDRVRKGRWEAPCEEALERLADMSPWGRIALGDPEVARGWKDDLLRLLFACCHPALATGESAALALSTVLGLSTREVANAFVAEPRTMEQRLTRARRRLRERGDSEGTSPERAHDRLDAVLAVIHLLFNEGYWSTGDGAPIRTELCRLALGLAHSLFETFPNDPEVAGLLALLTLHDARREARQSHEGALVPLPEQDRTRWDHAAIDEGLALLDRAFAVSQPGPFQIEAAIVAVHCRASTADRTDWKEIAALYALLERFRRTPAVRVNRAYAVARAEGAIAGLTLLDLDPTLPVAGYPYVHLVRGSLLAECGKIDEARASLSVALGHARNTVERAQIMGRIAELDGERRRGAS